MRARTVLSPPPILYPPPLAGGGRSFPFPSETGKENSGGVESVRYRQGNRFYKGALHPPGAFPADFVVGECSDPPQAAGGIVDLR